MKRLGSSDSLGALMSICPPTDGGLEELEGCVEEECSIQMCGELKKRRLSIDQVKALENNFEVENKLEPERKVKLAQELGLQPRQVAVWFQNRRARWKTKQLERDYGVLKANFDTLNHNFESLQQENQALMNEIRELKLKLNEDSSESNVSVKEEVIVSETDDKFIGKSNKPPSISSLAKSDQATTNRDCGSFNNGGSIFPELKDDDSDSSAVLNEDNSSPNLTAVPPPVNCYQFSESKVILGDTHKVYQPQYVKIEEHNFFSDEACNFFSDDQAPTLQWYCSDQWG